MRAKGAREGATALGDAEAVGEGGARGEEVRARQRHGHGVERAGGKQEEREGD